VNEYIEVIKKNMEPCAHGIKGGMSRLVCNICASEKILMDELKIQSAVNKSERDKLNSHNNSVKTNLEKIRLETLKREITYYRKMDPFKFESEVAKIYEKHGYSATLTSKTNDEGKDIILKKNNEIIYVECKRFAQNTKVSRPVLQKLYGVMVADEVKKGIIVTTSEFTKEAVDFSKKMGEKIQLIDGQTLLSMARINLTNINANDTYKQYCIADIYPNSLDLSTLNMLKSKNINYNHKPCGDLMTVSLEENHILCRNNHKNKAIGSGISESLLQNDNTLKRLFCPKCGSELSKKKQSFSNKKFWGCSGYPNCRYTRNN
jgi:HJR/Mrr/RecB family endonuclease